MEFAEARRVLAALADHEVEYVLIGSMAMAAQGIIRATRDMDFFVAPHPENIERLRRALRAAFDDDPDIEGIDAAELAGDYPALQYGPPNVDYSLDILTRLGEAFAYEDLEWETVTVEGTSIRVATPRTLVRMKRDTVRPQDRLDADTLRRHFGIEDE